MDTPSASQSEAPHQQWVGHCGSPPENHQNPIPTYQYLTLTPSYPSLSNGTDNNTTWPGGHGAPHSAVVCPGKPASSPCSPNGSLRPQLMPPQPSRISHQLVCPRLPLSDQRLLNGPQSPLQKESSCSAAMLFANADLSQPHPAESFPGHTYKDSSLMCPIQQQPQCTVSPSGDLTRLVPHAAGPDKSLQSSTPESRYGLDPRALPSAVKVMAEDQAQWEGKVYASEPISSFPPLATTAFTVEDKGSASPFAIRATSYCFPRDGQTSLQSHLPLGALVSPLAGVNHGQSALPECAESESIGGCGSCGASMCPAMGWQDCGQRFSCPFCGKLSDVPWQFYQPTQGVEGIRVDKEKRPELSLGSYEVINHQRGEAAVLLLAIDVSVHALRGGHLEFVTHQIRSLLTSLSGVDEDDLTELRVGLITYDGRIHLYDLSPTLSRPHMLVITDADELQLPVAGGLLVPLKDCIDSVSSVLHLIPQFAPEHDDPGGVPIELPVKGALAILQTLNCPGKLLIFHAAPLIEAGPAQPSGFFNSNKPKSIFEPSEVAASLVRDCVGQGCSVHLFHVSQELVGGAWPGHIPYLTGGALHNYSHLQGEIEKERFSADLEKAISMKAGFKAVLKIYVSKVNPLGATGAERHQRICREGCSEAVKAFPCFSTFDQTHGDVGPSQPIIRLGASRVNFFRYNNSSAGPTVVAMASVDWWTTVAVEVEHVRNLDEANSVAIQSALAYSTWTGERRTRIHTTVLKCSQHLQDAFRHFQAQELLSFYTKKMYCAVLERPLQELREELQTQITEALACYRKHCCSASVSAEQLVLPQSLRALPVYVNSLRKSEVLLPGLRSSVHQRLQQRCQVLCMNPSSTVLHFYPQLLPLSLPLSSSNPPKLEEVVRCSSASLNTDGLYLVNAPLTLLLWVGRQVPTRALMELFNTSCFSALPSGETKLPVFETPLSIYVRAIINSMNSQFSSERKLWVVKQGDSCEETLQRHLVEDKSPNGGASYADFLYHLHVNSVRFLQ